MTQAGMNARDTDAIVMCRTTFVNGEAHGVRRCQFIGQPMLTLVVPRDYVKEAESQPDVPMRGVYYLLAMKNRVPCRVYAGQTTQGVSRLEGHLSSKQWWDVAVMFLDTEEALPKDVVDGLEAAMIKHARQYASCKVDNGVEPKPRINHDSKKLVSSMRNKILWRMDVLGYRFSTEDGLPEDLGAADTGDKKRNPPFNFEDFGIADGAELVFYDAKAGVLKPKVTAKVYGKRKVRFRGRARTLSDAARLVMGGKGKPRGVEHWSYNGRLLIDIYREKYPL